jgi:hypothetical protein
MVRDAFDETGKNFLRLAMHARVPQIAWLNIILKASVRSASCLIGQGRPGREDARHDDETTDPLESIAPAANGRVILA